MLSCSLQRGIGLCELADLPPLTDSLEQLRGQLLKNVTSLVQWNPSAAPREEYLTSCDGTLGQLRHLILAVDHGLDELYSKLALQRNARTRINELPDDILRIIFNFYVEDAEPQHAASCAIRLSQVCSHWHAVAQSNAAMWSCFDMKTTAELVQTLLARSGGHKKRLSYGVGSRFVDPVPPRTLDLLDGAMETVVELDISLSDQRPFVSWLNNNLSRAPVLHTLMLNHQGDPSIAESGYPMPRYGDDQENLPEAIRDMCPALDLSGLLSKAPNLRHLILDDLRLPWKGGRYSDITVLRISHCFVGPDPSDSDMFELLRDMPRLEELDLSMAHWRYWYLPSDRLLTTQKGEVGKVALSHLRVLRLLLPPPYLFHILEGLEVPEPLPVLDLTIRNYHHHELEDISEDTSLCPVLSRLFRPGLLPSSLLDGSRAMIVELPLDNRDVVKLTGHRDGVDFMIRVVYRREYWSGASDILEAIRAFRSLRFLESCDLISVSPRMQIFPHIVASFAELPNVTRFSFSSDSPFAHKKLARCMREKPCFNLSSISLEMDSLEYKEDSVCDIWMELKRRIWPGLTSADVTVAARTGGGHSLAIVEEITKKELLALRSTLEGVQTRYPEITIRGYGYVWQRGWSQVLRRMQLWPALESELADLDEHSHWKKQTAESEGGDSVN